MNKLNNLLTLLNERTSKKYIFDCSVVYEYSVIIVHNIFTRKNQRFAIPNKIIENSNMSELSINILKGIRI